MLLVFVGVLVFLAGFAFGFHFAMVGVKNLSKRDFETLAARKSG